MQSSSSSSILVVDDEEDIVAIYKEFIEQIGYDTTCFTSPLLALEHYKQFHKKYSLIITDMKMPQMNGIEFADKIRRLDHRVKIYLITAYEITDTKDHNVSGKANFDVILKKPIDLLELQKRIKRDLS